MKLQSLALAALLAASAGAQAASYTIDFDTTPGGSAIASGTAVTNQYAADGVTFASTDHGTAQAGPYADYQYAATVNSYGNALWNCALGCNFRADTITISFASAASGVSWLLDSEGPLPITFNAYDSNGTLLQSVSSTSSYPSYANLAFTVGDISRIDAVNATPGWAWSMDNLSFSTSAVPEPTELSLMLAGLAAIGVVARRRAR